MIWSRLPRPWGDRVALEHGERKLAAILAADVVGYSRLAAADEATHTSAAPSTPECSDRPRHIGTSRPRCEAGDGALVEFGVSQLAARATFAAAGVNHKPKPTESRLNPLMTLTISVSFTCSSSVN